MCKGKKFYLKVISQLNHEPISLSEAKLFLRIDSNEENNFITDLIKASRSIAENYLQKSLISKEWQVFYYNYQAASFYLPHGPVTKINEVILYNSYQQQQLVESQYYYLDNEKLSIDQSLMSNKIQINYQAGYDSLTLPSDIKQGILLNIGILYENKNKEQALSNIVEALYRPHRLIRI